ncbi:hypothetical protein LguiB_005295 [Lonicera macranthoides]
MHGHYHATCNCLEDSLSKQHVSNVPVSSCKKKRWNNKLNEKGKNNFVTNLL